MIAIGISLAGKASWIRPAVFKVQQESFLQMSTLPFHSQQTSVPISRAADSSLLGNAVEKSWDTIKFSRWGIPEGRRWGTTITAAYYVLRAGLAASVTPPLILMKTLLEEEMRLTGVTELQLSVREIKGIVLFCLQRQSRAGLWPCL